MNNSVIAAILSGLVLVITNVVTALAVARTNWGIEKKKLERQERRALIDSWQKLVARQLETGGQNYGKMIQTEVYLTLRGFLDEGNRQELEAGGPGGDRLIHVVRGRQGLAANPPLQRMSDRIQELKREWGLS